MPVLCRDPTSAHVFFQFWNRFFFYFQINFLPSELEFRGPFSYTFSLLNRISFFICFSWQNNESKYTTIAFQMIIQQWVRDTTSDRLHTFAHSGKRYLKILPDIDNSNFIEVYLSMFFYWKQENFFVSFIKIRPWHLVFCCWTDWSSYSLQMPSNKINASCLPNLRTNSLRQ